MASRRPSSRPSRRRRTSSDASRTTREINAEKSRQRRAAAQAAKLAGGESAPARGAKDQASTDRKKRGARRGALAADRHVERDGPAVLSIGGLDVSTRLVVVLTVAAILAVMLVPSVYQWWQQERELAQIKAQVAEQQEKNAQMQRQLDLWNDPDYISTQARERLGYVRPGETQYTVVDPGAPLPAPAPARRHAADAARPTARPSPPPR